MTTGALIPHSRPWIADADRAAVDRVLAGGMLAQGRRCRELEHRLSAWLGAAGAVGTACGTAALTIAVAALAPDRHAEIIVPTYVCPSTADAIRSAGATPIVCDVGPHWVVDAASVAARLSRRTRAVVVPHVYGIYADVDAIAALGVPVIEDCAQALDAPGARPLRGRAGILSFHPTKLLTAGEGGMAVALDRALADRMATMRDGRLGGGTRRTAAPLSDLAAALALSQLDRYEEGLHRRRSLAWQYAMTLGAVDPGLLARHRQGRSMYSRFPVTVPGGLARVDAAFAARGVTVRRGVDRLIHRELGLDDRGFPNAVELFETTVSLPLYPALTDAEFARCLSAASEVFDAVRHGEVPRCA